MEKGSGCRPPYIPPKNHFTKAQEPMKLITYGKGVLGVRIRTDIKHALGLQKGQIVYVTIEVPPQPCGHHHPIDSL